MKTGLKHKFLAIPERAWIGITAIATVCTVALGVVSLMIGLPLGAGRKTNEIIRPEYDFSEREVFYLSNEDVYGIVDKLKEDNSVYSLRAREELKKGNIEKARKLLTRSALFREKSFNGDREGIVRDYLLLGKLAFYNDTLQAFSAYKKVTEYDSENYEAWLHLGHLNRRLGEMPEACRSYNKVLEIAESTGNRVVEALAYNQLGVVFLKLDDREKALALCLKALDLNHSEGCEAGIGMSYGILGILSEKDADFKKAENYYREALEINRRLGNKPEMIADYRNLGICYTNTGDYDKSRDYHERALLLAEELGHKPAIGTEYTSLGILCFVTKDYEEADKWYSKSLRLHSELRNKEGLAAVYANKGSLAEHQGNYVLCSLYWKKALSLYTEIGAVSKKEKVQKWINNLNREKGV